MAGQKNSPVSLWLTLGFGIGVFFGWFAFHTPADSRVPDALKPPPPPTTVAAQSSIESPLNAGTLGAVELTFLRWGGYVVWEDDVTEFAAWNPRLKRHADFYEVRRTPVGFYFRTIPALTKPLIDHGISGDLPMAFTEPKSVRERFYREHPGYNPATAPRVELPPKPPERHSQWLRNIDERAEVSPPPSLTPGDGKN